MKLTVKLWIFIAILAALTPIGLKLPELAGSGPAWGEWDAGQLKELAGYIPRGLARYSALWHAPIPDYAFSTHSGKILRDPNFAYIISAVVGILAVIMTFKFMSCPRKRASRKSAHLDSRLRGNDKIDNHKRR